MTISIPCSACNGYGTEEGCKKCGAKRTPPAKSPDHHRKAEPKTKGKKPRGKK